MVSHSLSAGKITHFIILLFVPSNRKCAIIIEKKYLYNYASVYWDLYYIQQQKEKYDLVHYGWLQLLVSTVILFLILIIILLLISTTTMTIIKIIIIIITITIINNNNNIFISKHHAYHSEIITFYIITLSISKIVTF